MSLALKNNKKVYQNKSISIMRTKEGIQGWLSIIPIIAIILVVRGYPMIIGIAKSFTNWDGLYRSDFIGLQNYIEIFKSNQFWLLLKNNLIIMVNLPIQLILGLIVSLLLYEGIQGWKFFRFCVYLPQVVSTLTVGYLFVIFFGYNGPLNDVLSAIGLEQFALDWLGKSATGLMVIIICIVWIDIGWQSILFMGGMSSIAPSIFEAARIDGAGYWTRLFKITIPMLIRTIEYSCVMSILWNFTGLFNLIFSITKGGPGYETTTVDYMIYLKAFRGSSEFGYASTIAVLLMIIVTAFTVIQMKVVDKVDDWGE